jgi:hypothetical protein
MKDEYKLVETVATNISTAYLSLQSAQTQAEIGTKKFSWDIYKDWIAEKIGKTECYTTKPANLI